MKKNALSLSAVVLALVLVCSTAFPWGSATHAYIADNLGKQQRMRNLMEVYGAMVPDLFNYMFDVPYQPYLHDQTHGVYFPSPDASSVLKLMDEAKWELQEAITFGWISHNDAFAADSTAHWSAITNPIEGYVITKAQLLNFIILGAPGDPDLMAFYSGLDLETQIAICHNIVETAGDVIIKRMDPQIGSKIVSACLLRRPEFPSMLARAYARDFATEWGLNHSEGVRIIRSAEKEFRKMMLGYGQALMQSEPDAVYQLSLQMALLAEGFLGGLPSTIDFNDIVDFIQTAVDICINPTILGYPLLYDFETEIDLTLGYLETILVDFLY